jgi:hypothetical protein
VKIEFHLQKKRNQVKIIIIPIRRSLASIKLASGSNARQASRSFLYGDIRLAIQIKPASEKSFATSAVINK